MKVLVLNGSPKKKSDTLRLTDAFLKGLNKNKELEVHMVHVIDKKIAPCRGCFGCWKHGEGHCVIPKAAVVADPLLERFEQAGEEYAESLKLSPETIAALETPMIPKEEYIRMVNAV